MYFYLFFAGNYQCSFSAAMLSCPTVQFTVCYAVFFGRIKCGDTHVSACPLTALDVQRKAIRRNLLLIELLMREIRCHLRLINSVTIFRSSLNSVDFSA